MTGSTNKSISRKLTIVIMATTFIALFAYASAMLAYDVNTYRNGLIKDLTTQANIIAEVSAPALEFNDPITAVENLQVLRTRPSILRAAIFTPDGKQFAKYQNKNNQAAELFPIPQKTGVYNIVDDKIEVWRPVVRNEEKLGMVYINANYEADKRLSNFAIILAYVMCGSLGIALLVAMWLRGTVTKPILAITSIARNVMQTRDFSLRAKKFTEDEIGVLADAFNDMLREVERRTKALQESNKSLEHEMTERNAAEAALRLADLRKDEFLATLAHELRNPLAPLSTSLEVLRIIKDNPHQAEKAYAVMQRQLEQMVRLVDDLLDTSRINTGKLTISKTQIDIQSIIHDAIESSSPFIKSCGHTLSLYLPSQLIYIEADPLRLAQVFSNILNNAAKYTDKGGQISIEVKLENNNEVSVSISDSGIGLEPEALKNIFNMFTQVNQSLERTHAGLGVGLALAKHLIELHNYQLEATSPGLGKGSTFTVRLVALASQTIIKTDHQSETVSHNLRNRIMLVDDNIDYVTAMATLLESMGHEVRVAHNGFNALEIATEFIPQIAFLDIGMPGMSGYDLAQRLRQLPETANIILVAITGWGQESDRQLSRNAGFNNHLVKPVQLAQILKLIDDSFNQSPQ